MSIKLAVSIMVPLLLIAFMLWQLFANRVPEPSYRIVRKDGAIELRQYPTLTIAEVDSPGERYNAINQGFRKLAHYIFGGNQRQQKIAMTAPVMQQQMNDKDKKDKKWITRFVMPAGYTQQDLPIPRDTAVHINTVPAKEYVVIRFNGANTDGNLAPHLQRLRAYIQQNKLQTVGEPLYAFYNPPWIVPFLRRNEILLEISAHITH